MYLEPQQATFNCSTPPCGRIVNYLIYLQDNAEPVDLNKMWEF